MATQQPVNFTKKEVEKIIWEAAINLLGEIKVADSGLWLIEWNNLENLGVIQFNAKYKYQIMGVLSLIFSYKGKRINLIPLLLSGTIKSLREKLKK